MKITPLEIRQHEFEKTFRGYNIEEVDNFLSNISQEWERVLNESKMLRMQLEIAEKEANKLREIEMTLFKTLKTAEDTSTMITEQANQQADKHVQEARLKGEQIIIDAQQKAANIIRQAEQRAKYIKDEVLGDVKILEKDFKAMDHYKSNLMVQMKSLANATLDHVQRFEQKFDKEGIEAKFVEATTMLNDEEPATLEIEKTVAETPKADLFEDKAEVVIETPVVENIPTVVEESISFVEEKIEEPIIETVSETLTPVVEEPVEIIENVVEEPTIESQVETEVTLVETPTEEVVVNNLVTSTEKDTDDLSIIEGIGPKIANILFDNGVFTFRQLATTPVYKIREMLDEAGSHFSMHDPSTWVEQALLAAEERWDELDALKDRLIGGREVVETPPTVVEEPVVEEKSWIVEEEKVETPIEEPVQVVQEVETQIEEQVEQVVENQVIIDEEPKTLASTLAEKFGRTPEIAKSPADNNIEAITEEMLEKVNKVKMAIRKAMVEKADSPIKDTSPLPTVNDVISKKSEGGGSFFDNL